MSPFHGWHRYQLVTSNHSLTFSSFLNRECPVSKVKLGPLVQLVLLEIRDNKENLVKKDQLDLKDELDRKVLLVHLVPRVTR